MALQGSLPRCVCMFAESPAPMLELGIEAVVAAMIAHGAVAGAANQHLSLKMTITHYFSAGVQEQGCSALCNLAFRVCTRRCRPDIVVGCLSSYGVSRYCPSTVPDRMVVALPPPRCMLALQSGWQFTLVTTPRTRLSSVSSAASMRSSMQ